MSVFRLTDARTDALTEVQPTRRRLLRVCVHAPTTSGEQSDLLRVLLVADVVARSADLQDVHAVVLVACSDTPAQAAARLKDHAAALNIHPPGEFTTTAEVTQAAADYVGLHITGPGTLPGVQPTTPLIEVGPVQPPDVLTRPAAEPLAARLVLLEAGYRAPAVLTEPTLAEAGETLAQWRRQVASWATFSSRPIHPQTEHLCRDALADDLDTGRVVSALHRLAADPDVPEGAKFETFAHLDRILGLDLARDIGRI